MKGLILKNLLPTLFTASNLVRATMYSRWWQKIWWNRVYWSLGTRYCLVTFHTSVQFQAENSLHTSNYNLRWLNFWGKVLVGVEVVVGVLDDDLCLLVDVLDDVLHDLVGSVLASKIWKTNSNKGPFIRVIILVMPGQNIYGTRERRVGK